MRWKSEELKIYSELPRFVSDELPGFATGESDNQDEKLIKDELGWSIRYTFSGSCTTINNEERNNG